MIKKTFLFYLIVAFSLSMNGQAKKDSSGHLIGYAQKSDFLKNQYKSWFEYHYKNYQPDQKIVKEIKKNLNGISVVCFMGTWCGDSKRGVPKFYKIMEQAEFDFKNNFTLIALDQSKKTPDNLQQGYNIIRIPTFIFYRKEKEIGRFVEYPRETMEKDILQIVQGKTYKHSYEK